MQAKVPKMPPIYPKGIGLCPYTPLHLTLRLRGGGKEEGDGEGEGGQMKQPHQGGGDGDAGHSWLVPPAG
jgi:hypothetical protein